MAARRFHGLVRRLTPKAAEAIEQQAPSTAPSITILGPCKIGRASSFCALAADASGCSRKESLVCRIAWHLVVT
jgi:hypothetical protein